MARFIIAFGWDSQCEIVEAKDRDDALHKATTLSMAEGLLDDDLADTTWAEPYDDDLAIELGLIVLDDLDASRAAWKSAAPWR